MPKMITHLILFMSNNIMNKLNVTSCSNLINYYTKKISKESPQKLNKK